MGASNSGGQAGSSNEEPPPTLSPRTLTYVVGELRSIDPDDVPVGLDIDGDFGVDNEYGQALAVLGSDVIAAGLQRDIDEGEFILLAELRLADDKFPTTGELRFARGVGPNVDPCACDDACGCHLGRAGTPATIDTVEGTVSEPLAVKVEAGGTFTALGEDIVVPLLFAGRSAGSLVRFRALWVEGIASSRALSMGVLAGGIECAAGRELVSQAFFESANALAQEECPQASCPSWTEAAFWIDTFDANRNAFVSRFEVSESVVFAPFFGSSGSVDLLNANGSLEPGADGVPDLCAIAVALETAEVISDLSEPTGSLPVEACDPVSQAGCPGAACSFVWDDATLASGTTACHAAGATLVGEPCATRTETLNGTPRVVGDCAAGHQCTDGVCTRICSADTCAVTCKQAPDVFTDRAGVGTCPSRCDLVGQDCLDSKACFLNSSFSAISCAPPLGAGQGAACSSVNECGAGFGCHLVPELGPCGRQCTAYCTPSEGPDPCDAGLRCVAVDAWFGSDAEAVDGQDIGICVPNAQMFSDCCEVARCDGTCIDTTSDRDHCGSCGATCAVPGQQCVSSSCACPADVDGTPSVANTEFTDAGAARMASIALIGLRAGRLAPSRLNITYHPATVPMNTPIDLAGGAPLVTLEDPVDLSTLTSELPSVVTTGEITVSSACETGIAGTLSGLTLAAIPSLSDPTPSPGGCTFAWASFSFDVGTCP